jgi:hypothetical protein
VEQRRHRQGGPGHGQAGPVAADGLAEHEHSHAVAEGQDHGDQPVDHGAVDDPVDVVQPEAEDRDPEGQGNGRVAEVLDDVGDAVVEAGRHRRGGRQHGLDGRGVGEPLELLALHPGGPAEAGDHGGRRGQHQAAQDG